jgi:transposase
VQLEATQQQLGATQQQLHATQQQLKTANQRIDELEKKLGGAATAKVEEPFSMRAEQKRQEARGKKKRRKKKRQGRRGRVRTEDKIKKAARTEAVYPEDVPPDKCWLSHVRPVWRLENGRAILIAYQIFRGPYNTYGKIPGVLGRSEFGLEIVTELAYLVYTMGQSFAKACELLDFFHDFRLRTSQAGALLYQLSRHWEHEFDALCTLLANSLVVHADETSWSLNSVWAFLSEKARVLLFGVHKDAATLKRLLDPATFAGLVFSDDAAVYAHFTASQKCWAHLLRKAIKLTLQDPTNAEYRAFTDELLEIYEAACRVRRDQRLSDAGRAEKVTALEAKIARLCAEALLEEPPPPETIGHDYSLLVEEIMRLALAGQLFPFVSCPPVAQPNGAEKLIDGTNNESERVLRDPAKARLTGRTNKTAKGARRQTILTTVLESLRLYLKTFTLASVVEEVKSWVAFGQSCFTKLLKKLRLTLPKKSVLDQLLPNPSG